MQFFFKITPHQFIILNLTSTDHYPQATKSSDPDSSKSDVEPTSSEEQLPKDEPSSRSEPASPSSLGWSRAVAEAKEQAMAKLQEELRLAHEELKHKDEEVARLSRIRQDVEAELEELTASLFQVSRFILLLATWTPF